MSRGPGAPRQRQKEGKCRNLPEKELTKVCCPPEIDGTGESTVWDRKPNHCCKLTGIQLMNPESCSQMAARPMLLASAKVNPSLLQMASSMVFAVMS